MAIRHNLFVKIYSHKNFKLYGICVYELLVCVRMHMYAYVFVSVCCIHVMCMSVLHVRMLVLCVFNSASPVVTIPYTLFYKKYKHYHIGVYG